MHNFHHLLRVASVLASLAGVTLGGPIERSDGPSVLLCNDKNLSGYCVNLRVPSGLCVTFTEDINGKISSLRPAPGNTCLFFVAPDCTINENWFHWDVLSLPDLSVTPVHGPEGSTHNFENQLSSLECWTDAF
ncbi:uncharacterized protein RSE6_11554 [Rhynchosporium secalis]|uniref:Uncharacterized protein n=1 Tax=Rhynchosporium secalis TaxID=38038 RepID=A0A1E1MN81_RHYSE|nr:uncharacterized protein RSE6_11554 [Rhynchosporium secalis]